MMVTFGNASGPVEPMSPLVLAKNGSLFLTRPRVGDYYATPEDTMEGIGALFGMIMDGHIRPHIGGRYDLADVPTRTGRSKHERRSARLFSFPDRGHRFAALEPYSIWFHIVRKRLDFVHLGFPLESATNDDPT